MNSFRKIAFGMVAAMIMGMMVATPASAAVTTALTVDGNAAVGGSTALAPVELSVPADNSVDIADALRITITGLANGTTVSASATNGRVLTALVAPVTASAGAASASVNTGTGTTAEFFVFTTTTATGSVAITIGSNVSTYYFKGLAGALNSIAISAPATAPASTAVDVVVSGFDVFGNPKGNAAINLQVITATTSTNVALTTDVVVATLGTKKTSVVLPATGKATLVATATVAAAVPTLTVPVGVAVAETVVRDLAAELAAEKAAHEVTKKALADALAQAKTDADAAKLASDAALAAKDAEIAKLKNDTRVMFNSLARKWNKAFPKARVALMAR